MSVLATVASAALVLFVLVFGLHFWMEDWDLRRAWRRTVKQSIAVVVGAAGALVFVLAEATIVALGAPEIIIGIAGTVAFLEGGISAEIWVAFVLIIVLAERAVRELRGTGGY